jgi:multidrug efflux pump
MSMDVAEQQVQAAINAGANLLPSDLPMPPLYSKVNPADAPVLTLAITSPSLPVIRVNDLVENRLAPKLSQVKGVGLVAIAGGRRRPCASRPTRRRWPVRHDAGRCAHRHCGGQRQAAKGSFDGPNRASTIDANDQLQSAPNTAT